MTFEQSVMIRSLDHLKTRDVHADHDRKNKKIQNMTVIKNNSLEKDAEIKKIKKKPSYRLKRATWFEKKEYEKLLVLLQTHYPEDFPKKDIVDSVPTLKIRQRIKKENKISLTDLMVSRFLHQYITVQQHKPLLNKEYENLLSLTQSYYPKDFTINYSANPTRSVFKRIAKDAKINISNLTMCRFFNQYLKNQKSFLKKQEKIYNSILIDLQNIYPEAFPKEDKKLLKLGIFEDIKSEGKIHATDDDLKAFLKSYTKSEDYLGCYFTTPVRHDLK